MRSLMWPGLLAVSVSLAACGSSSPGTTALGQAAGGSSKALNFGSCMRSHGVPNFPDLTSSSGGAFALRLQQVDGTTEVNGVQVNGPAFKSAMQACRSELPGGGHPGSLSASRREAALRFSRCMRAHGVPSFPDPQFSGGGVRIQIGGGTGLDPNAPAFKSAQQACQSILGGAFKGPRGA